MQMLSIWISLEYCRLVNSQFYTNQIQILMTIKKRAVEDIAETEKFLMTCLLNKTCKEIFYELAATICWFAKCFRFGRVCDFFLFCEGYNRYNGCCTG